MTFTVELGWWMAPLLVTLVAIATAFITAALENDRFGLLGCFAWLVALVASLVAWLIWAIVN